jgi:glutamate synthase (NADPH) small chain
MPTKNAQSQKTFLHEPRVTEEARPKGVRLKDYHHVYNMPQPTVVKTQAQRCMGCGVPFCHGEHGCPLHNVIPEWNELMSKGQAEEALTRLHDTNNFPEFTGQLCPAPCESACVLSLATSPVTIRQIELSIVNEGFARGLIRPEPPRERLGKSIGIVGSGPAGLASAQELARRGYDVTVYEKTDRPGGLLRYGIPDFKMEKWILDRRLAQLRAEGVEFVTNCEVGVTISLDELSQKHHAVGLALGAEAPRLLPLPGHDLMGIIPAMTFLTHQNRLVAGDPLACSVSAKNLDVVIIGGGDTGSDCLGTALRQGARSVKQFELLPCPPKERSPDTPWPLWPMQLRKSHAHEEGGERLWSIATTAFIGHGGAVTGLQTVRMQYGERGMTPIPGSQELIPASLVILAAGFTGVQDVVSQTFHGININSRGQIITDPSFMTSRPGFFAAGDARRGASLIVWAIAEGRRMAHAMDRYLLPKQ